MLSNLEVDSIWNSEFTISHALLDKNTPWTFSPSFSPPRPLMDMLLTDSGMHTKSNIQPQQLQTVKNILSLSMDIHRIMQTETV